MGGDGVGRGGDAMVRVVSVIRKLSHGVGDYFEWSRVWRFLLGTVKMRTYTPVAGRDLINRQPCLPGSQSPTTGAWVHFSQGVTKHRAAPPPLPRPSFLSVVGAASCLH